MNTDVFCVESWHPKFFLFTEQAPAILYYSHIPTIILSLLVGIFIYLNNRKLPSAKILLFISFFFSFWSVTDIITWVGDNSRIIMFSWMLMFLFEILIFVSSLYFSFLFIKQRDPSLFLKIIVLIIASPIIFLLPSKYNANVFDIDSCEVIQGPLVYYVYFLEIFFSLWIVLFLSKSYFQAEKESKKQILYFSIGIVFFLLSFSWANIVGNFMTLWNISPDSTGNWELTQYGLFGMPVFLGFLSYLIVKNQAFNIKVIAAQFLTVAVWLAVFSQLFLVQERFNLVIVIITLILATIFGWLLLRTIKKDVLATEELSLSSAKLSHLNKKLQQIDRAKSEFISIASHQLRTPLTSIKGFSSLILENTFGKIPKNQRDAIEKIFVNNEKLVLLVEDMLNASRLEAGRLQYDFEETEILPLVKEATKSMRLYAKSKKLYLKFKVLEKDLPRVICDKRKISELILNLIDNAIKYTKRGGIEVVVEKFKRLQRVGKSESAQSVETDWVRIKVVDTGIGMKEKELVSIFEKFKKGPTNKENGEKSGGTGLGVYISRQIALAHGGRLYAESAGVGKGSTFVLELPGIKSNGKQVSSFSS